METKNVFSEQDTRKIADFIDIAKRHCNLKELEKVRECLEAFNRKHGYYCEQQLDDLDSTIYLIKHKNMISQEVLEMIAKGQICLDGCQINFGDHCTQNMNHADKKKASDKEQKGDICDKLKTDKAMEEFAKIQKAGMLDEQFQPINLTRAQMGCIVIRMGSILGLDAQWKDFGNLWHIDSELLRTQFCKGQDSKPTRLFNKRLCEI